MKYISTAEAAEKWNISQRRVVRLAKEGRIDGATFLSKSWMIPEDTKKPLDGRTKQTKTVASESRFRFPLFVNYRQNSFNPPLSEEESSLRTAELDFMACDFEKAYRVFPRLAENAENIYVKIAALFFMCICPGVYKEDANWNDYYLKFHACFDKDFPNKKDMEVFIPWIDVLYARVFSANEEYRFDNEYNYHQSSLGMNAYISMVRMSQGVPSLSYFDSYEIICANLEKNGFHYEAIEMHITLFLVNYMSQNEKNMMYHLNKAVEIANERGLLFPIANVIPYYPNVFSSVLKNYPKEFVNKLIFMGDSIHNAFAHFTQQNDMTDIYAELPKRDYSLLLYAYLGYPYKQVADIMHLSERTIAVRYSAIFEKLGVKNKNELRQLYINSLGHKESKHSFAKNDNT